MRLRTNEGFWPCTESTATRLQLWYGHSDQQIIFWNKSSLAFEFAFERIGPHAEILSALAIVVRTILVAVPEEPYER